MLNCIPLEILGLSLLSALSNCPQFFSVLNSLNLSENFPTEVFPSKRFHLKLLALNEVRDWCLNKIFKSLEFAKCHRKRYSIYCSTHSCKSTSFLTCELQLPRTTTCLNWQLLIHSITFLLYEGILPCRENSLSGYQNWWDRRETKLADLVLRSHSFH